MKMPQAYTAAERVGMRAARRACHRSDRPEGQGGVSEAQREEGAFPAEGRSSSEALLQEAADRNAVRGNHADFSFTLRFLS